MRYLIAFLLLASASAHAVPVRYELSGSLTQAYPGGGAYDQYFYTGQTISGWYEVDWNAASAPQVIHPGQPNQFAEIVNLISYSLDIGPFRLASGGFTSTALRDQAPGSTDSMTVWDVLPTVTNDVIGGKLFDDIFLSFFDPTGTGYGLTETSLGLDRFLIGSIAATQGPLGLGFAGVGFDASVIARQVPEPATLLLFLAGLAGLGLARRHRAVE